MDSHIVPSDSFDHLPPDYVPAAASDFFASLLAAAQTMAAAESTMVDVVVFYRTLGQTLRLSAEQKTAFNVLTLGGLFAKIDYLCKEHRLPWALRSAVNSARIHVSAITGGRETKSSGRAASSAEGATMWRADLQAVSEFIAVVYAAPIPSELRTFFPASDSKAPAADSKSPAANSGTLGVADAERPAGHPVTDALATSSVGPSLVGADASSIYLRATVVSWTADVVEVRTEDAERLTLALRSPSGDWTYLTKFLREGSQLNLIRPRREDETLHAELIIYEPDYLVDVTAVAGCFEEYSDTPFLHLLHKIAPFQTSVPILLGNLAGAILDEETRAAANGDDNDDDALRYDDDDAVSTFLRDNALTILALEAEGVLAVDSFLAEAEVQRQHIRAALSDGLRQHVGSFSPADVVLEPSFVSEMLGLQGRMDFLQLDHRVLIEQKAGKGGYNLGAPDVPRQATKHYVQMLLYMAILRYNFHRQYRRNDGNLQAFLLYSRYAEPLLGLGPAPRLLFDAVKMRNGIVRYEELYCTGSARLLERMTADKLNRLNAHGLLWDRYQRPQLEALLAPIQAASALERDYYFRMLQFVTQEHRLAKVGNNTAQTNCYASKWFLSLAEKHESGEIYDRLSLVAPSPDEVAFAFPASAEATPDTTNFRLGDVVIFYPYAVDGDPDCRQTMVHRGTLVGIAPDGLRVQLRSRQSDVRVFTRYAHQPWAVEHDSLESSFGGLYSATHAFLSAPQERRDLLLLQRPPRVEPTPVRGDYGPFADLAQRVKSARDLFLIIGPPGTGKTSYGMLYTLREQLLEPSTNVLLLSYTNRAVDEICSKLVEDGIPFLRIGNAHNCEAEYRPYLLQRVGDLDSMRRRIAETRVFVGTTTTMAAQHALFALKTFDLAIIDEASQILEPHLLGLLSMRHGEACAIRKFVMIGDHKQLPAVVQQSPEQSAVSEPSLQAIGLTDCRLSLFERLLRRYGQDPSVTYMLRRQGRMHQAIAAFPSRYFYEGLLDVVPLPHQIEEGGDRLTFIPAPAPADSPNDKVNAVEARIIADLVRRIAAERPGETIGVIVPYRNQISAIRSLLPDGLRDLTIDTVERYQGSQRDHIIYGFTVQKRYQLAFLTSNVFVENGHVIDRKLNVAMTRARRHLYLVGNPDLLGQNQTFARLMAFAAGAE